MSYSDIPAAILLSTSPEELTKRQFIIESVFPQNDGNNRCESDEESHDLFWRIDTDGDSHLSAEEFSVYAMEKVVRNHYDEYKKMMEYFLRYSFI